MATIKVGDTIPSGKFFYVPYSPEQESADACGRPIELDTNEWKDKKVVLFGAPGAFTPTCTENHVPPYIAKAKEFHDKGVNVVAVVTSNDAFVSSAWGKILHAKDKVLSISDPELKWLGAAGLTKDMSHAKLGLGVRSKRFALVIENLKVTYVGVEEGSDVTVSGADAVLAKL